MTTGAMAMVPVIRSTHPRQLRKVSPGTLGAMPGQMTTQMPMRIMKVKAIKAPGMNPARNSRPMDVPVLRP